MASIERGILPKALLLTQLLLFSVKAQCTATDSDTCYIDRNTAWTPGDSNIQCDGSLKRCIITCSGSSLSCSSGDSPWNVYIICPVDAISCIINCESVGIIFCICKHAQSKQYTKTYERMHHVKEALYWPQPPNTLK